MKKSAIISAMFTMMLVLTSFNSPLEVGGTGGGGKNPNHGTQTLGGGKNPTTGTLSVGVINPTDGILSVGGTGGGGKNPKGTI